MNNTSEQTFEAILEQSYIPGSDAAVKGCANCGTTDGFLDNILTDDGETLLVCDGCGDEIRRQERVADQLSALPSCEVRQAIIDDAKTIRELVNRLKAHDLGNCLVCEIKRMPRIEPMQARLFSIQEVA